MSWLTIVCLAMGWTPVTPEGSRRAAATRSTAGNAFTHEAVGMAQAAVGRNDEVLIGFVVGSAGGRAIRTHLWRGDGWIELPELPAAVAEGPQRPGGWTDPVFSISLSADLTPWIAWGSDTGGVSVVRLNDGEWEQVPSNADTGGVLSGVALANLDGDVLLATAECGVGGVRSANELRQARLGPQGWATEVLRYEYENWGQPCFARTLTTIGDSRQKRAVWQHLGAPHDYELIPNLEPIEAHDARSGLVSPDGDWYEPTSIHGETRVGDQILSPDFVASAARSAGTTLVATGFTHLGSSHEWGQYNRVAIAGLDASSEPLVGRQSLGERVERRTTWTQLPSSTPIAMVQSWKSVSVLGWTGDDWVPLGVSGPNKRGLGLLNSADTRPELMVRDGRLIAQWDSQSERGSVLMESELRGRRWSRPQELSRGADDVSVLCSGEGYWLPAFRGGGGRIGQILCDSQWDSVHGSRELAYEAVLFGGRVLGPPVAQRQPRVAGEDVTCFGTVGAESAEQRGPRNCGPNSTGLFSGLPAVVASMDRRWWLAVYDGDWRAFELPRAPLTWWQLVGDADYWVRISIGDDGKTLQAWTFDDGVPTRFDTSASLPLFSKTGQRSYPDLNAVNGTTTAQGSRVLGWIETLNYVHDSIRIGIWSGDTWEFEERGLPQGRADIEHLEIGALPDGRPVAAWSEAGEVFVKVLTDSGWVGFDGTDGNVSRSADPSSWPSMVVHGEELCVAWAEADEGASQIVVHCTSIDDGSGQDGARASID